jgi:hypothetical protein
MAKYMGNSLAFKWGATTFTANLIRSVELKITGKTDLSSGAGDTAETYLPGKTDAKLAVEAWDDAAAANLRAVFVMATETGWELYPQGNSGGNPKISGNGIVLDKTLGTDHEKTTPVTIDIQVTGAVSETTV